MTTPAGLEAKAVRLREIAADLRREATKVSGLLGPVKDLHTDETWQGPVAVEFSGTLTDWAKRAGAAQTAILDAATAFDRDANNLDVQAGDQRRAEKEKAEKEKGPR
ncbi:hypothetical protein [Streptomyces sp. SID13031]|uniref:hypothetical protein n=1 Tax=Streptomyces sp. SID13031 TaxID=2706046 RepID=UPI0013CBD8A0|nr:hypothetical protein [Streptomyces sp. SID13031]NEA31519.1 hypothetical protein [Streptomyces sp. SID13031]